MNSNHLLLFSLIDHINTETMYSHIRSTFKQIRPNDYFPPFGNYSTSMRLLQLFLQKRSFNFNASPFTV